MNVKSVVVIGGLLAAGIVVARIAFQSWRNSGRVCRYCLKKKLRRSHDRELQRGLLQGTYEVLCIPKQTCLEVTCSYFEKEEEGNSYVRVVRASLFSLEHWKYKHLLDPNCHGRSSVNAPVI